MTSEHDFCMLCGVKPQRPNGDFCSNDCYLEAREAIAKWLKDRKAKRDVQKWPFPECKDCESFTGCADVSGICEKMREKYADLTPDQMNQLERHGVNGKEVLF